ncbi:MAG: hypothetical protein OXG95_04515 [Chloroflexi bacterium]|nr:hypothetical protein [Chloroflexota bacterium]
MFAVLGLGVCHGSVVEPIRSSARDAARRGNRLFVSELTYDPPNVDVVERERLTAVLHRDHNDAVQRRALAAARVMPARNGGKSGRGVGRDVERELCGLSLEAIGEEPAHASELSRDRGGPIV